MGLYSDYIFPQFFDSVVKHCIFDQHRQNILGKARGKILEIGIGTGLNLDFYPSHVAEITAVDPNPGMEKQLLSKLKKRKLKVRFYLSGAENLPFESGSFDTVVSTITLCSIPHLSEALREIRRVLKTEGQFIFLEHGLSSDVKVARWQRTLNPLWGLIGSGCKLTVDSEKELKAAGFEILSIQKYYVEKAPKFIGFLYEGVAKKGSKVS